MFYEEAAIRAVRYFGELAQGVKKVSDGR